MTAEGNIFNLYLSILPAALFARWRDETALVNLNRSLPSTPYLQLASIHPNNEFRPEILKGTQRALL